MQPELYTKALNRFITDHNIPRDLASRVSKAAEELGEVAECAINRDLDNLEGEVCDLCNVAFDMLQMLTSDPWGALLRNPAVKDEKYREGRRRVEAKK